MAQQSSSKKDDPAQQLYSERVKPGLRNTEPFAAAAVLLVVASVMLLFHPLVPLGLGVLIISLSTVSLVRLQTSQVYQGKIIAMTTLICGIALVVGASAYILLA